VGAYRKHTLFTVGSLDVVDFLLVITELISLDVTAEALRAKIE